MLGAFLYLHFPRVWRVWSCVSLQTCAIFPAFVVVSAAADHICRVFSWRLLSVWLVLETFAVYFSRVWSAHK